MILFQFSDCDAELPCRGPTNTEPGAVATGFDLPEIQPNCSARVLDNPLKWFALIGSLCRKLNPVATAPGSVFADPQRVD